MSNGFVWVMTSLHRTPDSHSARSTSIARSPRVDVSPGSRRRGRPPTAIVGAAAAILASGAIVACSDDDAGPIEPPPVTDSPAVESPDPSALAADIVAAIDTRDEDAFLALVDEATMVNYFTVTGVGDVVALFDWMDIVELRLDGPMECNERTTNSSWCVVEQTTVLEAVDGSDHPPANVEVILRDGEIFSVVILPVDAPRATPKLLDDFEQFVADRTPDDLALMYRDAVQIQPNTTDEALAVWRRHVDQYTSQSTD